MFKLAPLKILTLFVLKVNGACNYGEVCAASFPLHFVNGEEFGDVAYLRSQFCSRVEDVQCLPQELDTVQSIAGWTCAGTTAASLFSLGLFGPFAAVSCSASGLLGVVKGIGWVVKSGSGWDITLAFGGAALDMFGAGEVTAAVKWARSCKTIGALLREAKVAKAAGKAFQGGKVLSHAVKARNSARALRNVIQAVRKTTSRIIDAEATHLLECLEVWASFGDREEL